MRLFRKAYRLALAVLSKSIIYDPRELDTMSPISCVFSFMHDPLMVRYYHGISYPATGRL